MRDTPASSEDRVAVANLNGLGAVLHRAHVPSGRSRVF
jgi:hypothetical protein